MQVEPTVPMPDLLVARISAARSAFTVMKLDAASWMLKLLQ